MKTDQHVFQELIARRMPSISAHLTALGVSVEVLTTQWFLCIFLNSLSMTSALRVWDSLFLDGSVVIFQVWASVREGCGLTFCSLGVACYSCNSVRRKWYPIQMPQIRQLNLPPVLRGLSID